jgi:hypothetical protein
MTELIFERDYAREMLFTAIRHDGDSSRPSAREIAALVEQAAEVGCSRTQLIVELADLAARLFARSAPEDKVALARELADLVTC